MNKIDFIIVPYGAGSSFLGYLQEATNTPSKMIDVASKKYNLWDLNYEIKFVVGAERENSGWRMTEKQRVYKNKSGNVDLQNEAIYRKFALYTLNDLELTYHNYPIGIEEHFDTSILFFLDMDKERFDWCWRLAHYKHFLNGHENQPRPQQQADIDKEWSHHMKTKAMRNFSPEYMCDYDDIFINPNDTVIKNFLYHKNSVVSGDIDGSVQRAKEQIKVYTECNMKLMAELDSRREWQR